jgi:hypothetical protein
LQAYFTHRVYLFSRNVLVGIGLLTLCTLRFVGGVVLSVLNFMNLPHEPDYFAMQDRFGWVITSTFSIGAAVDVCVAVTLCLYLAQWRGTPALKTCVVYFVSESKY